jgi:hypothetical protein
MTADSLPANAAARGALHARLASLRVKLPAGQPSVPLAAKVSRRWYDVAENDRGIKAVALDLTPASTALLVRTAAGESRTPLGAGSWVSGANGFASGMEKFLAVPPAPAIAASGAWSSDSTFTVKLIAPQTPFYTTLALRFEGDRLRIDTEHNVSFGPTKLGTLEGRRAPGK